MKTASHFVHYSLTFEVPVVNWNAMLKAVIYTIGMKWCRQMSSWLICTLLFQVKQHWSV